MPEAITDQKVDLLLDDFCDPKTKFAEMPTRRVHIGVWGNIASLENQSQNRISVYIELFLMILQPSIALQMSDKGCVEVLEIM